MAIEAVRQLEDPTRESAGYCFSNTTFCKALVIPSTGSVEVQFCLRPAREKSGEFLAWSDFRICAYEKGVWSDICCGAIATKYGKDHQQSAWDLDLERRDAQYRFDYENSAKICNREMDSKHLYQNLEKIGLVYGPSFQAIRNIRYNHEGEALGIVNLHEWMAETVQNEIQPHLIHPAALDAIFQVTFAGLSQGGSVSIPTMVPTTIRKLWIFKPEKRSNDEANLKVHVKARSIGFRNAESSILAIDARNGTPTVVGGIETTSIIGSDSSMTLANGPRRLCYVVDWKPDMDLLEDNQISSYCASQANARFEVSESMVLDNYLACYLALIIVESEPLSKNMELEKPHLLRYTEWIQHQISKNKTPYLAGLPIALESMHAREKYLMELFDKIEKRNVEGKVIARIGRNLQSILKGEIDALELLFSDKIMNDYYRFTHDGTAAFQKLALHLDALVHKKPNMRFLEIGAGTGGATIDILRTLAPQGSENQDDETPGIPRFTDYTFTDISPAFLESAKERFNAYGDRILFSILNIEQDPLQQAFESGAYDVIVASNVLHATASLRTTLENTRKLLKPGGKLILYELIDPHSILPGFIFGLFPGWWLSTEDYRQLGPLINEENWHNVLSQSGFSGIDTAHRGYIGNDRHVCSVIISTAVRAIPTPTPVKTMTDASLVTSRTIVIITGDSPRQLPIARQIKSMLEEANSCQCRIVPLKTVASIDIGGADCIFLPELEEPFLSGICTEAYACFQNICASVHGLLWLTTSSDQSAAHPANNMIHGMSRCLQGENTNLKVITLAAEQLQHTSLIARNVSKVFAATLGSLSEEFETEYSEKEGLLCINRVTRAAYIDRHVYSKTNTQTAQPRAFSQDHSEPVKLTIGAPGLLDTLQFIQDPIARQPIACDEIEVQVKASGLNFRDVLIALGQDSADYIGCECAGIVSQVGKDTNFEIGDRVCCLLAGSMATYARCKAFAAIKIPDDMSFTKGAAAMVVYATAYYALVTRARMQRGDSILIHSGAGGLGQASIQLAQLLGASDIYVTVGSSEKSKLVQDLYNIPENHIFSSRTQDFAHRIKALTNGRGIDIIVNSLAGEALRASWDCIAPMGRFLETGKKDIFSFGKLPMFPFSRNATYSGIDLFYLLRSADSVVQDVLQAVMILLKDKKISVPFPLDVYRASQIEEAFRCMQSGKSKGKLVIEFGDNDIVPVCFS